MVAYLSHRIHVWYIYTYIWLIFMVNACRHVGKYLPIPWILWVVTRYKVAKKNRTEKKRPAINPSWGSCDGCSFAASDIPEKETIVLVGRRTQKTSYRISRVNKPNYPCIRRHKGPITPFITIILGPIL